MAHMVKWKFRQCSPNVKNHTINNYIDYISNQVKERREGTGLFEGEHLLGMDDESVLSEKIKNSKTEDEYNQNVYLKYINERKGSAGMFSNDGANIEDLTKSLKAHEGAVWIPIVSLKEDEAREYNLDTEAAWMLKARELAEGYRKALGISPENYRWVAAFHTKAPLDQNPFADSGCQPHLHFMLWEETPIRRIYKLNDSEMDQVHQITGSVLSKEYMQTKYQERNRLESLVKEKSLSEIDKFSLEIQTLMSDIKILTEGKGRLNVKELERREELSLTILEAMEDGRQLTQNQLAYKEKMGINSIRDAKRVASNYADINERLNNLVEDALELDGVKEFYEKWTDISLNMRKAHRDLDNYYLLQQDAISLQNELKNSILKEARLSMKENIKISDKLKGTLYSKLENGLYSNKSSYDDIYHTTEVLAQLCKSVEMPEYEAKELQSDLLGRSDKDEYEALMEEIVSTVYKDMRIGSFNVTSRDFWKAMKNLQNPLTRYEKNTTLYENNQNSYDLVANTIISPISHRIIQDEGRGAINALLNDRYQGLSENDYEGLFKSLINSKDDFERTL